MNIHVKPEIAVDAGPKIVVGRWQDKRGKTWIELYEQEIHGQRSFGYHTSWGANGWFGLITLGRAMGRIEEERHLNVSQLIQVAVKMGQIAKAA